jgi:hypothetical protein
MYFGAGEGNRTLIARLEIWSFTTKLHPRILSGYHYLITSTKKKFL